MLDVLFKTEYNKINYKFNAKGLKAGIVYSNKGKAVDKILFYEQDNKALEVWNDTCYSLDKNSRYYVDDIISIGALFIEWFHTVSLTYLQLLMGYKMFLNDTNYLSRHLEDFGYTSRDVGYDGKKEFAPMIYCSDIKRQELFRNLIKIINYRELNYKYEEKFEIPTKTRK